MKTALFAVFDRAGNIACLHERARPWRLVRAQERSWNWDKAEYVRTTALLDWLTRPSRVDQTNQPHGRIKISQIVVLKTDELVSFLFIDAKKAPEITVKLKSTYPWEEKLAKLLCMILSRMTHHRMQSVRRSISLPWKIPWKKILFWFNNTQTHVWFSLAPQTSWNPLVLEI